MCVHERLGEVCVDLGRVDVSFCMYVVRALVAMCVDMMDVYGRWMQCGVEELEGCVDWIGECWVELE